VCVCDESIEHAEVQGEYVCIYIYIYRCHHSIHELIEQAEVQVGVCVCMYVYMYVCVRARYLLIDKVDKQTQV
jgi:hypothetical protein